MMTPLQHTPPTAPVLTAVGFSAFALDEFPPLTDLIVKCLLPPTTHLSPPERGRDD